MRRLIAALLISAWQASASGAPARFELDPAQSLSVMNRRLLQATTSFPLPLSGGLLVDTPPGGGVVVSGLELDLGAASTMVILGPFAIVDVGTTAATLRSVGGVSLSAEPGPVAGQTVLGPGTLPALATGAAWHSAINVGCASLQNSEVPCVASIDLGSPEGRSLQVTSGGVLSGPPGARRIELQLAFRVPLPGPVAPWGEHLVVTTIRAGEVAGGPTCRADFNGSGAVEVSDIFAFLSAWFGSDPRSDVNDDGARTVADIFAFLTLWFTRC